MTTKEDLLKKLELKFQGIPNLSSEVVGEWLDEALAEEGFASSSEVPDVAVHRILLCAQIIGVESLALNSAHYFNFRDGEESISKGSISSNYLKQLELLKQKYSRIYGFSGAFKLMRRLDRP